MKWKSTVPTVPGFYYWQGGHLTGNEVAVVQVRAYFDKSRGVCVNELCINGFSNVPSGNNLDPNSWGGHWAGPLPQPF